MKVLMLVSSLDSTRRGATDGFIVDWVRVLARKVDQVAVLTYWHNVDEKFPTNVQITLVRGNNLIVRNLDLFTKTFKLAGDSEVIFGHILEIFGIVAGIVGKLRSKKSFLWYCQGYDLSTHIMAKLAMVFIDKVFTSTNEMKERYVKQIGPWIKNKVICVGHGLYLSHYD